MPTWVYPKFCCRHEWRPTLGRIVRRIYTLNSAIKLAEVLDWIATNRESLKAQWEEIVR